MKAAKKLLILALAAVMLFALTGCALKALVQKQTQEALSELTGIESSGTSSGSDSGSKSGTGATGQNNSTTETDKADKEFTIYVNGTDEWTPFPGESGVTFEIPNDSTLSCDINGGTLEFTGLNIGDVTISATLNGKKVLAHVRVRAMEGGQTWTIRFDTATVMDVLGLAVVDYALDCTATHTGADMFGIYTGEIGMVYDANLSGLQSFLAASGVDMDYNTDGWFKNTNFKMQLSPYSDSDEQHFVDSLKDPNVTDAERDVINSYMGDMFAGVGSGDEPFEKSSTPIGLWYDWAFHMTEGDMSAYVNMNSAMFSASGSQNATAQYATGYAHAILAGSFQSSQSYENQSPFPYQIEVYESGEAVLTLRNPTESPIVVKFYGTITKS